MEVTLVLLILLATCLAVHPDRAYLPSSIPYHFKNLFEPVIPLRSANIIRYPIQNPVLYPFLKSRNIFDHPRKGYDDMNGRYTKETSTHFSHSTTTRESGVQNQRFPLKTYEVVKVPVYSFAAYETTAQNFADLDRKPAQVTANPFNRVTAKKLIYLSKATSSGNIAESAESSINISDGSFRNNSAAENKYRGVVFPMFYEEGVNKSQMMKPATSDSNRRQTSMSGLRSRNLYTKIDVPGITFLPKNMPNLTPISSTSYTSPFVSYQYDIPRVFSAVQSDRGQNNVVSGQRFYTKVSF